MTHSDAANTILLVGFGSIGRRHLRNLRALGQTALSVYRTGRSTLPADELADVRVYTDLDAALAQRPLAAVIANPTALHIPAATAAAEAGCHLLLEKPIAHNLDGVDHLQQIVASQHLTVLVGFQFRFHPGLQQIKRLLASDVIGPVVSAQAHWGEYLPNWHPWEDYRQSYSARPELGGGVVLTLCHPFDYLRWLLGEVVEITAQLGYNGGLEIAVEDTAQIGLRFESGAVGSVHLSYVERPHSHWLHLVGQRGTIHWDNRDGHVRWYRADADTWDTFVPPEDFERNTMFMDQMAHFLACLRGTEQADCTLADGVRVQEIALAVKRAAADRATITLSTTTR
ncbi:MAG: Gfo/Idh/MocA family oxidoreductase [Chloroflexi bacterium]|nr:Gfo/Idh/MocA family oxidoreductase [Chloroflexota bacterium]